jgi:thiol-disulfide isomerase/thioredoxin
MTGASIKHPGPRWRRKQGGGVFRGRESICLNFVLGLPLLLCCISVSAESAKPGPVIHATLKAASEAASADQSLVLLIFGAEWCGPCHKLKKETLASSDFLEKAGVIHLAEVDIDLEQKTAREFGIGAVPTLILLTPDGKIVTRREGFMPPADLLAWNMGRDSAGLESERVRDQSGGRWFDRGRFEPPGPFAGRS